MYTSSCLTFPCETGGLAGLLPCIVVLSSQSPPPSPPILVACVLYKLPLQLCIYPICIYVCSPQSVVILHRMLLPPLFKSVFPNVMFCFPTLFAFPCLVLSVQLYYYAPRPFSVLPYLALYSPILQFLLYVHASHHCRISARRTTPQ